MTIPEVKEARINKTMYKNMAKLLDILPDIYSPVEAFKQRRKGGKDAKI